MGAAFLAGLGAGLWRNRDEIASAWSMDKEFIPVMEESVRSKKYSDWKRAIDRSMKWER